ncbi:MAG TPA: SGNH/GDSL hydrolase family protein [Acidobacteriaceae bacterium]|jgi:lysophospholipase L1-like esterase|nr:SGNH/GDSL hydrolase family protein [Acidobacteriaceae bacterium]
MRVLLRLLILVLVLLAGAELTLRYVLGLGNPVLVAPDAACGYILKPNQDVERFFCHTQTNQYGMRSGPIQETPAPGTLRLFFLGDSVTYGTSRVDQSRLFTQILRRELPSVVHRPVEVLNASASAWAIDNELSYLRSRGTFHSDLVLLVLNSGDPGQPRAEIEQVGEDSTLHHSTTAIGELWIRWFAPRILHIGVRTDAGDQLNDSPAVIRANLADLDAMQTLTQSQHSRLAILYIPFRGEMPAPANQAQQVIASWSASHSVPVFDMTQVEAAYPTKEITLDGSHLNRQGNALVARAVEEDWDRILHSATVSRPAPVSPSN